MIPSLQIPRYTLYMRTWLSHESLKTSWRLENQFIWVNLYFLQHTLTVASIFDCARLTFRGKWLVSCGAFGWRYTWLRGLPNKGPAAWRMLLLGQMVKITRENIFRIVKSTSNICPPPRQLVEINGSLIPFVTGEEGKKTQLKLWMRQWRFFERSHQKSTSFSKFEFC